MIVENFRLEQDAPISEHHQMMLERANALLALKEIQETHFAHSSDE